MNRGEQRTLLRERIKDKWSLWWSDSDLDTQLNLSAQAISSRLSALPDINYGRSSFTINNNGVDLAYILTSITAFLKPIDLIGGADGLGGTLIPEADRIKQLQIHTNGKDDNGKPMAYLTYDPAAPTQPYSFNWLVAPLPGTYYLLYQRTVTAIATGTGNDSQSFVEVPAHLHESIVEHAAHVLLGHDNAITTQAATGLLGELLGATP